MTEKRIALFLCLFLWKIHQKEKKLLKQREVKIIIHGDVVIKQMGETEKVAFMAALLARVLETANKHERGRDNGV
jgi:hypothetical protein